jgi:hypothetical protein
MPKKKRRRKPRPAPRPQAGAPRRRSAGDDDALELLADVRDVLDGPEPHELLELASSLLDVTDPRGRSPFDDVDAPEITPAELVTAFAAAPGRELTALLAAFAALIDDDLLERRIRRELAARDDPPPAWLRDLEPLTVGRAVTMGHVLGDGDNMILAAHTAAAHPMTVVAYVDHNLGTVAKDAFILHEPIDRVLASFREASGEDPDTIYTDLDLADARARLTEAIDFGAHMYPPLESDTWPAVRPLVEWVVRQLPPGGRAYERPAWSEARRRRLAEDFAASAFGRGLAAEDHDLLDNLLWFGCDYGTGDPLQWSRVRVEMLLGDWLPRKIVADADHLARAPDLLRRFVRFAHAERGLRRQLTDETLAAVDEFEPEYQQVIRSPWPQGVAALMEAMGALSPEAVAAWPMAGGFDYAAAVRNLHVEAVGGEEALENLDAHPLPDEPLQVHDLPDDIRAKAAEVARLTDACCDALLDVEHRTACRRLLVDVADADPNVLRRRGRSETAAAAIVWIVVQANGGFSQQRGGLTAKAVGERFGVADPGQRAPTFLRALGRNHSRHSLSLGSPRYLVAGHRAKIIKWRDREW